LSYKIANQLLLQQCTSSLVALPSASESGLLFYVEALVVASTLAHLDVKVLVGRQPFRLDFVLSGNGDRGNGVHG